MPREFAPLRHDHGFDSADGDFALISSPADTEVLTYQASSGKWINAAGSSVSELSDLSDVNTSTPTNRFALIADGVDFESRLLVEADISDLGAYLLPVITSVTTDEILQWDGSNWINQTFAEAGIADSSGFMPLGGGTFTGNVVVNADMSFGDGRQLSLNDSTGITATNQTDHPFQIGSPGSTDLMKFARASLQAVVANQTAVADMDLQPLGGRVKTGESIFMKEIAAALVDIVAYGQVWVKNTTPCQLWFTDDAGTDTQIV